MKHTITHNQQLKQTYKFNASQKDALDTLSMSCQTLHTYIRSMIEKNPFISYSYDSNFSDFNDEIGPTEEALLKPHLYEQLWDTPNIHQECASFIIESLDEHGFLNLSVDNIALTVRCSNETVCETLRKLYTFEPLGCFAYGSVDALIIQAIADHDYEAVKLLSFYREMIEARQVDKIAKGMDCSVIHIRGIFERLKKLNPFPCANYNNTLKQEIIPDILIDAHDDTLKILPNTGMSLSVNDSLFDLIKGDAKLKKLYASSKSVVMNINRRNATLVLVTQEIVDYQAGFFLYNDELQALTQAEVASKLEMHQSTVSRCIMGKFYEFEGSIYPLHSLFLSSTLSGSSSDAIKKALLNIVNDEDKLSPLTDTQLQEVLMDYDLDIARRTIVKYRKEMGIPNSNKRRKRA